MSLATELGSASRVSLAIPPRSAISHEAQGVANTASAASLATPPAARGPRLTESPWAVLLAALLIALAVGIGIDRLHGYAKHIAWETAVLMRIDGLVYRLHALEEQAQQSPSAALSAGERIWASERETDLVQAQADLDEALAELTHIDPEDRRVIGTAFAQYLQGVEHLAGLVAAGRDDAAQDDLLASTVDPAYAALRAAVDAELLEHEAKADRTDLLVQVGAQAAVFAGALAIGLLFLRAQRATAAAAHLEGERQGLQAREQELRDALAAEHAATRAIRQFLLVMSHELRTPMQVVMGYAELLLAGPAGSLTPEQSDDVQTIQRGAKRLVGLVTQMLDFSRLDAGQMTLKCEPVALSPILEEVRRNMAPQAAAKSIALQLDLPAELPPVPGDPTAIHQILLNLIGNAVKFTEQGEVRIGALQVDGEVAVAVRDTGIGIADDTVLTVFDEFRQVDTGMTRRYEGAGLGLAIARKLAEAMGGRLSVESLLGHGSTFTLYLPLAPVGKECSGAFPSVQQSA